MTIDGTNISVYGLMLSYVGDHLNQPARKRILKEPGFLAKDIRFEGKEPAITLIGKYDTKADMLAAIEGLNALIRSALKHNYILVGHGVSFTGVVSGGIKVDAIKTLAKVTFKVKITT